MHGIKPVLYILGVIYCILAATMLVPVLIDLSDNNDDWHGFIFSMLITGVVGMFLMLSNRQEKIVLNIKQAILLTPATWFSLSLFACIPLYFSELNLSFSQAYFEAVSAFTTTGATVITGLDNAPKGILMWRSILQYLGGMGIIVMALMILPTLGVGGMQVFKNENFSVTEKHMARSSEVAKSLFMVYTLLCLICAFLFYHAGMSFFDAVTHSFFTLSTGGFSNYDASFGYFNNIWIDIIAIVFMFMGALPFILYYRILGGSFKALVNDSQVRAFFGIVASFSIFLALWLDYNDLLKTSVKDAPETGTLESFFTALHYVTFNLVSVITSCGFVNTDYSQWGPVAFMIFIMAMMIGGCTGSTAGGIKVFRVQILFKTFVSQIKKLMSPHGIFRPQYNHKSLKDELLVSLFAFLFVYVAIMMLGALILTISGLDFLTSITASPAMLSNIGPALGPVAGPAGNYSSFNDLALWTSSFLMILGRLEFLVVLIIFTPAFWRE